MQPRLRAVRGREVPRQGHRGRPHAGDLGEERGDQAADAQGRQGPQGKGGRREGRRWPHDEGQAHSPNWGGREALRHSRTGSGAMLPESESAFLVLLRTPPARPPAGLYSTISSPPALRPPLSPPPAAPVWLPQAPARRPVPNPGASCRNSRLLQPLWPLGRVVAPIRGERPAPPRSGGWSCGPSRGPPSCCAGCHVDRRRSCHRSCAQA